MAGDTDGLRTPPSGWASLKLGDIADVTKLAGFEFTKYVEYIDNGEIIALRAVNVANGRLDLTSVKRITKRVSDSLPRSKLNKNDVLLTYTGTIGQVAVIPSDDRYHLAPNVCRLRVNSKADFGYVFAFLRSSMFRQALSSFTVGSTQPTIPMKFIRQIPLPLPTLPEQKAIARVLGALDDKIELNRRMNETLEAMARALFKSWFVDFDPVRAKRDGRKPVGLDKETAALFPADFQDSELGHTPQGWEVSSIDNIANYLNGLALQKYPPGGGPTLPVIKIAQLRKGDVIGADLCNTSLPSEYVVQDGDVLFSWSGSLEVKLWCGGPGALNQHLFKVTSTKYPKWFYYLWTLFYLDEFRLIAADKATTMGHIQRGHLSAAKALIPSRPLLNAMNTIVAPLFDQIVANRIQSRTLAALRDALLPKLLSGEMSVGNVPT